MLLADSDRWCATVRAPQGGPIYVHNFEGNTVAEILADIGESLDLERASSVQITFARETRLAALPGER
jgi:hypothetical protein